MAAPDELTEAAGQRPPHVFELPLLLGAVALVINLTSIARPALWRDEIATMVVAQRSPSAIVAMLKHDDAPLGAYYLLMHFWIKVSTNAVWLRLPSAVGAAAAVSLLFLLGKRLSGRGVGVVAGLVLAVMPFGTRYAQEARPYALVMCGATAATWLLVSAVHQGRRRQWVVYAVVLAATVALHVMSVTLIAAHLVTLALAFRNRYRRYLPWLISIVPALVGAGIISKLTAGDSTMHAWIQTTHFYTFYDTALDFAGARPALAIVLGAPVVAALVAMFRRPSRGSSGHVGEWQPHIGVASVALPWLFVPAALLIAASRVHPLFVPRYVLFSLPALAFLAGAGMVSLWRAVRLSCGPRVLQIAGASLAALALVVAVAQPQAALRRLDAHGDDPKAEAAYLIPAARPGDGIVYSPRDLVHSLIPYGTAGQLPVDALLAISPAISATLNGVEVSPSAAASSLLKFRRVWLLDVPGLEDTTPLAAATSATLAAHYRQVSSTSLHGTVLVLYERIGS